MDPGPLNCKLLVVGESDVGKTAIVHKYVNNEFREKIQTTVAVDISTAVCHVDNKVINLQIWDTAGQEHYHSIGNAFYRNIDACMLVYDITNKSSFELLENWRTEVFNNVDIPAPNADGVVRKFPLLILGNKLDKINEREVNTSDAEEYAKSQGCLLYEVSAKTGENINDAFQKIAEMFRDYNKADITRYRIVDIQESKSHSCC